MQIRVCVSFKRALTVISLYDFFFFLSFSLYVDEITFEESHTMPSAHITRMKSLYGFLTQTEKVCVLFYKALEHGECLISLIELPGLIHTVPFCKGFFKESLQMWPLLENIPTQKFKRTGKRAVCMWVGQTVVSVTNWLWSAADKARSLWAWSALCFFWHLSKGK